MKNKDNKEYLICPNQERPYELFSKKIKLKKTLVCLKKYIEKINKYHKNVSVKEMLELLKKKGCTYAYVTNTIFYQFLNNFEEYNDELFSEMFGFSLKINDKEYDLNILMVDIFSCLYKVSKFNIFKWDIQYFKNTDEAYEKLVKDKKNNENKDSAIFLSGYIADGLTEDGLLIYKSRLPEKSEVVGTYDEIVKELFNIEINNISKEELDKIFEKNNITYYEKDNKISSKFSGLTTDGINYWVNYYFQKNNINIIFESKEIHFNNKNVDKILKKLNEMSEEGYTISVSTGIEKEIHIYDPIFKKEEKISNKEEGHIMTYLGVDSDDNIIVESWGRNFIVKKENITKMIYNAAKIKDSNKLKHRL